MLAYITYIGKILPTSGIWLPFKACITYNHDWGHWNLGGCIEIGFVLTLPTTFLEIKLDLIGKVGKYDHIGLERKGIGD